MNQSIQCKACSSNFSGPNFYDLISNEKAETQQLSKYSGKPARLKKSPTKKPSATAYTTLKLRNTKLLVAQSKDIQAIAEQMSEEN